MAANTPEMVEAHFGVPMTGRRAQHAQHAPRCRRHRVHARPRRGQGADHRHRILADDRTGARARSTCKPLVIDIDDPLGPGGSAPVGDRLRDVHRRRRSRVRMGAPVPTSGTRSRSTTRRERPAIRRASSITIAARISMRCRTSSIGGCRGTPSICGRCRCSTATAGAFRGRWPPTPASTSACARSMPGSSSTRSGRTGSRTTAARRSSTSR